MFDRPNDQRGFVHKRLLGGIGGFIKSGFNPLAGLAGLLAPPKPRARATVPRSQTARPTLAGQQGKEMARQLKFPEAIGFTPPGTLPAPRLGMRPAPRLPFAGGGGDSPCRPNESARCCQLRNGDFREQARWQVECGAAGEQQRPTARATGVGDAVMGQFGAALEPGVMMIERSVCLPGMQLAKDGLCYNKGAITNSQRMWPRGRRPLLTGGDMAAISIAARAGAKLERTTKRLRALGMMKRLPAGRKPAAHAHAKPVAAVSVN